MVARSSAEAGVLQAQAIGGVLGGRQSATQWIIVVLLTVIATCWVIHLAEGPAWVSQAQAQTMRMGAQGIFAFPAQLGPRNHGFFMVDVDAGNVWCYEYMPEKGKLRLVAGRSYLFDRYLEEFNTDSPTPSEVSQLVQQLRANKSRQSGAGSGNEDRKR